MQLLPSNRCFATKQEATLPCLVPFPAAAHGLCLGIGPLPRLWAGRVPTLLVYRAPREIPAANPPRLQLSLLDRIVCHALKSDCIQALGAMVGVLDVPSWQPVPEARDRLLPGANDGAPPAVAEPIHGFLGVPGNPSKGVPQQDVDHLSFFLLDRCRSGDRVGATPLRFFERSVHSFHPPEYGLVLRMWFSEAQHPAAPPAGFASSLVCPLRAAGSVVVCPPGRGRLESPAAGPAPRTF